MPLPQRHPAFAPDASADQIPSGLFRESPVPMLLVDARSRRIARVNAKLCGLLGVAATALEGRTLREVDTADPADLEEYLLLALACGDDEPRTRRWRTSTDADIPVELRAVRLQGDQGTLLALTVRDLRDEMLRVAGAEASARAGVLLARKHEAAGRLAAGLARDLGAALDEIAQAADEWHATDGRDPTRALRVQSLLDAAHGARRLIRDFLAFTGREEPEERTVSLNDVVTDAEDSLRDMLPQDIGLLVRLCKGPAMAHADPAQLEEILVRLVDRGRRAMVDGGYLVVATDEVELDADFAATHPSTRPGPHVTLSVTDTGTALDEEAQSRIFEPFFSSEELGTGDGLGLATAYGLVKRNGGTIWVTSRPGVGTTFRVYLPQEGDVRTDGS